MRTFIEIKKIILEDFEDKMDSDKPLKARYESLIKFENEIDSLHPVTKLIVEQLDDVYGDMELQDVILPVDKIVKNFAYQGKMEKTVNES